MDGNDNRQFLQTLYEAVNNEKNANLHIEAGGRDEYMSPFIALVKYAYVQSTLEKWLMKPKRILKIICLPTKALTPII